jgi:DNA-binding response OmpR family regulator
MKLPPRDILLVEGHDDSREMVRWYLTQIGYQVRAASTCVASLSLVSVRRFNLYLLGDDCIDGTALDLCQQIRALDADTPILFCSASAFPADRERGMRAGAQAYLTKPLDWDELEQAIVLLINETRHTSLRLLDPSSGFSLGIFAHTAKMVYSRCLLRGVRLEWKLGQCLNNRFHVNEC